jgi:hypothetical protein
VKKTFHDVIVSPVGHQEVDQRKALVNDVGFEVAELGQLQGHEAGQRTLGRHTGCLNK